LTFGNKVIYFRQYVWTHTIPFLQIPLSMPKPSGASRQRGQLGGLCNRMAIMSEEKVDYIAEAMEMLNTHEPSIEIHHAQTVIRRRGDKLREEVIPAFIKITTDFKEEMKSIEPSALKVWLFLALSVNRTTEQAHPGIRTIAASCGMGENTVISAIKSLEEKNLIEVNREDRKYNIYQFPEYVSANTRTASKIDTTASENKQTASEKPQTASDSGGLTREPDEPNKPEKQHAHAFSSFESSQLKSEYMESAAIPYRRAHMMLLNITHLPAIPRDQESYIETVQAMVGQYGEDETKTALERACNKWISTQGKNGRNYSKTNFKWVDWAMDMLTTKENPPAEHNIALAYIRGEMR
jgi:hypothetical protein